MCLVIRCNATRGCLLTFTHNHYFYRYYRGRGIPRFFLGKCQGGVDVLLVTSNKINKLEGNEITNILITTDYSSRTFITDTVLNPLFSLGIPPHPWAEIPDPVLYYLKCHCNKILRHCRISLHLQR